MIKNDVIFSTATRVLSERPDATLQTIAAEAGISRTTIYNRFPTRESLLQALSNDAFKQIHQTMSIFSEASTYPFPQRLYEVTQRLIPIAPQSIFLRNVPTDKNQMNNLWLEATSPLMKYLLQIQNERMISQEIPGRWLVASYVSLLFAAWDEIIMGELGAVQASRLIVHSWLQGAGTSSDKRQIELR